MYSEIGRKEREEREAFRQLQEQGYKVKQEYIQQGKRTKDEKRVRQPHGGKARLTRFALEQSIILSPFYFKHDTFASAVVTVLTALMKI